MKYSQAKYIVKEIKRLAVEDMLRKHLSLLEFVNADKNLTRNIIKFWWKTSTMRVLIKNILTDRERGKSLGKEDENEANA